VACSAGGYALSAIGVQCQYYAAGYTCPLQSCAGGAGPTSADWTPSAVTGMSACSLNLPGSEASVPPRRGQNRYLTAAPTPHPTVQCRHPLERHPWYRLYDNQLVGRRRATCAPTLAPTPGPLPNVTSWSSAVALLGALLLANAPATATEGAALVMAASFYPVGSHVS
jgi:hypothetical protein